MTEPLTPPTADLQDFAFMPLHVARLRDSDLASEVDPEACWYAVLLWCASWHQLPAGSLPDNEVVLTKLCGLGRDVKTFRKHRDGAMRGFVKCSDGRLYHPVVAEQVHASWTAKLQQRWRSECARIKKANQRNETAIEGPTYEAFLALIGEGTTPPSPQSVPGDTGLCPSGQPLQETGTGTGTGISKKEATASSSPAKPDDVRVAFDEWNDLARKVELPVAKDLTEARRKKLKARIATSGLDEWREALRAVEVSKLCRGLKPGREGGAPWRASLDFLLQPASYQKLIEGTFGAELKPVVSGPAGPAPRFPGPERVRALFVAALGEPFAAAWVDLCGWQDVPDQALTCTRSTVLDRIRREAQRVLQANQLQLIHTPAVAA